MKKKKREIKLFELKKKYIESERKVCGKFSYIFKKYKINV